MSEAWIYSTDSGEAADSARTLAELGFSPRRVSANGSLRPSAEDGGAERRLGIDVGREVVADRELEKGPADLRVPGHIGVDRGRRQREVEHR